MTQREVVVRLCEAYVKANQTVEIEKIIKIADYIMLHTSDYTYTYPSQYQAYITTCCSSDSKVSTLSCTDTANSTASYVSDVVTL